MVYAALLITRTPVNRLHLVNQYPPPAHPPWKHDPPWRRGIDQWGRPMRLSNFPGFLLEAKLMEYAPMHRPIILKALEAKAKADADMDLMRALREYREISRLPIPKP